MNIQSDYEKAKKYRKIVKVICILVSILFILTGIFWAQICALFNLNFPAHQFNIYKYFFIGLGIYDFVVMQGIFKYLEKKQR